MLNQTEALVAIDVNSGSSTKYHNIEETALKTNLEAAEEIARQLRLRDMAGLVVIDFIDMEKFANRRSIEKKLKESLKSDRSKIQVGKISSFGLLEMSRQRIRSSIKEGVYSPCSNCDGTGLIRSIDSRSLELLRTISEISNRENIKKIDAEIPNEILNYLVNQKRNLLIDLENNKDASINFYGNALLRGNENKIRAFDLNNNEINLDKIIKNNNSIDNKNDSKQNKKRKKGKNNKSNKLDNDNKNKINNKNKESNNTESKNIKKSDQDSVNEKKSARKKSSKNKQNTGNIKKSKKDDNKIEKIKDENKIPLVEDLKKHQVDEIPKNVNHIGAPIKGDEKKEKPKSGWWNKD